MIIIPIEMPRKFRFRARNQREERDMQKTVLKRQITPEGKAPSVLKAERTSVREHFNALGNTAIGCEMVL
jgi:hypothetical protein